VDEVGLCRAAELALEELQIRLEQEIAQRDLVIAAGEETEAKLRESETALRQLFDQNLDSMMILNLETGRYIDINEEYSRNSGYSREEIVGKRSRELSSFEYVEENQRLVAELKRVGVVRKGRQPSAARTATPTPVSFPQSTCTTADTFAASRLPAISPRSRKPSVS